jgi:hypothetical protein
MGEGDCRQDKEDSPELEPEPTVVYADSMQPCFGPPEVERAIQKALTMELLMSDVPDEGIVRRLLFAPVVYYDA